HRAGAVRKAVSPIGRDKTVRAHRARDRLQRGRESTTHDDGLALHDLEQVEPRQLRPFAIWMTNARVVVGALEVAGLGRGPVDEARLLKVGGRIAAQRGEERQPVVDHARLRVEAEVIDGELSEPPLAVPIGPAADLEDERLTALAREGREVVGEVLKEFEV